MLLYIHEYDNWVYNIFTNTSPPKIRAHSDGNIKKIEPRPGASIVFLKIWLLAHIIILMISIKLCSLFNTTLIKRTKKSLFLNFPFRNDPKHLVNTVNID